MHKLKSNLPIYLAKGLFVWTLTLLSIELILTFQHLIEFGFN